MKSVNVLDLVRIGTESELEDCKNISVMILDRNGTGINGFNLNICYSLLNLVLLHVSYTGSDKSLQEVAEYLNYSDVNEIDTAFMKMISTEHDPKLKFNWKDELGYPTSINPIIKQSATEFLDMDDGRKKCVVYLMIDYLFPFTNIKSNLKF